YNPATRTRQQEESRAPIGRGFHGVADGGRAAVGLRADPHDADAADTTAGGCALDRRGGRPADFRFAVRVVPRQRRGRRDPTQSPRAPAPRRGGRAGPNLHGRLRHATTLASIVEIITSGIPGTDMPSFRSPLTERSIRRTA